MSTTTRPMPGPPQLIRADALGDWDSDDRWCNRWDLEWEDGRAEFDVLERHDKRMTDAECSAEYWRAEADSLYSRPDVESWSSRPVDIISRGHIWDRFATRSHALEG